MSQEKTKAARALAVPLHRRVAQSIRQDIVQRGLTAHTKIPSEVDLAKQYGVSHGTMTRALESLVRDGVLYRKRPQGTFVAEETMSYGETQSGQERILPRDQQGEQRKTAFVGIVVPHLRSDLVDGMMVGAEMMTRSFGYGLSFGYSEDDWALERYHIEQFLRQGVAGIIIFPGEHAVEERNGRFVSAPGGQGGQDRIALLEKLQRHNMPFVLIDRYVPEIDCNYVVSDDVSAGYACTQHLIKLGHRRVGFVTVNYTITSSGGRYAGYRQCLQDYDIPFDEKLVLNTLEHAFSPIHSEQALVDVPCPEDCVRINEYLSGPERPSAVVTMNDYVSLQVLQTAEEMGIVVPDDLAVVCSGGSSIGGLIRVPLTCITQPAIEIGRQSAYILLNLIAQRFSGVRHVTLPVSLVVRRSSGAETGRVPEVLPLRGE